MMQFAWYSLSHEENSAQMFVYYIFQGCVGIQQNTTKNKSIFCNLKAQIYGECFSLQFLCIPLQIFLTSPSAFSLQYHICSRSFLLQMICT